MFRMQWGAVLTRIDHLVSLALLIFLAYRKLHLVCGACFDAELVPTSLWIELVYYVLLVANE